MSFSLSFDFSLFLLLVTLFPFFYCFNVLTVFFCSLMPTPSLLIPPLASFLLLCVVFLLACLVYTLVPFCYRCRCSHIARLYLLIVLSASLYLVAYYPVLFLSASSPSLSFFHPTFFCLHDALLPHACAPRPIFSPASSLSS